VDVFHWIYAVTHCPEYRRRFDAALRMDFPRIPVPRDADQFFALTRHGQALAEAHLSAPRQSSAAMRSGRAAGTTAADAAPQVAAGFPRRDRSGRVALSRDRSWPDPIRQDVWEFRVGGYRVLERWLRCRRLRGLSAEDQAYFARMIATVERTLHRMSLLDAWSGQILGDA
jgi:hypothetical protein